MADNNTISSSTNLLEAISMVCLMRLTLMALGGYGEVSPNYQNSKLGNSTKFVTFPLPVESFDSISNILTFSVPSLDSSRSNHQSPNHPGSQFDNKRNLSNQITVACVFFNKADEVELLYIETCKTFSDLINAEPLCSSRQAVFLLQTLQIAARISHISNSCWIKSINEMIERLPLDLKKNQEKFTTSDIVAISDLTLKSCNLLFEVFVSNIREMINSKDFHVNWESFLTILAGNIEIANLDLPIYEETLEMIGALFRLLRPLPNSANDISSDIQAHNNSNLSTTFNKDLPATVSFENFEEDSLLRESWRKVLLKNPNIPNLLSVKHSKIISDLMKLQENTSDLNSDSKEIIFESNNTKKTSGVFSVFGF